MEVGSRTSRQRGIWSFFHQKAHTNVAMILMLTRSLVFYTFRYWPYLGLLIYIRSHLREFGVLYFNIKWIRVGKIQFVSKIAMAHKYRSNAMDVHNSGIRKDVSSSVRANSGIGSQFTNSLVDQEGFSGTLLACSVVARAMIKGSWELKIKLAVMIIYICILIGWVDTVDAIR